MTRSSRPFEGSPDALLHAGEVHVWSVLPDRFQEAAETAGDCLSEAERERALRLHSPAARIRFSVTRAALRHILSLYAASPAADLEFALGMRGKPSLAGGTDVQFSLSHARDVALVAVAEQPVGVDIEYARQPRDVERVARRVLHERTVSTLLDLPAERRPGAFLDAWTQREAHVKAVGGGLFHTPDVLPFDVDAVDDGSVRSVVDYVNAQLWSVARFEPVAGFRAALVVQGSIDHLRLLEWNGAFP